MTFTKVFVSQQMVLIAYWKNILMKKVLIVGLIMVSLAQATVFIIATIQMDQIAIKKTILVNHIHIVSQQIIKHA